MNKIHFDFLKKYSSDALAVDKLLVSSFLLINGLQVKNNRLLKEYEISSGCEDYLFVKEFASMLTEMNFEHLIELFEFVISPSEKIVNGAVYTPDFIRAYIVQKSIEGYDQNVNDMKSADLSCGCGGFLLTLTEEIKKLTSKTFFQIFRENIYGIDIASYSIQRSKLLLSLFALTNGEDVPEFEFNLVTGNSLIFDWKEENITIRNNDGFDLIVGNPPYVCSRNMDSETLAILQNLHVSSSGHPDLYIPFFQIGLEQLGPQGVLGYITVNSFIKSINGRALRQYFHEQDVNLTMLNFGGEQIFRDRNTYTCICFLKHGNGEINYLRVTSQELSQVNLNNLNIFRYEDLNHHDGWNLLNNQALVDFVSIIEQTGLPFKSLYSTKNGIATLKNDVYKFKPIKSDEHYFYFYDGNQLIKIERKLCKNIVNANRVKIPDDIERLVEQIIFPYSADLKIIPEAIMISEYPCAYNYLSSKKQILSTRDKGMRKYETWYAYGRRQSMDINAFKLFFPHICERPTFVICEDKDLLFYNGIALLSDNLDELKIIQKLLESDLFYKYIRNCTKDYASGYISMSRNYIKNFGVYEFTDEQKAQILTDIDTEGIFPELYGVRHLI